MEKRQEALYVRSFVSLIASVLILVFFGFTAKSVNADGLFQEQLLASFADRKATLKADLRSINHNTKGTSLSLARRLALLWMCALRLPQRGREIS
jgi:hypothetical protein